MRLLSKLGKLLFYLLVIAVLSGIIYYNRANYENAYEKIRLAVGLDQPCSRPLGYSIKQVDSQFGISSERLTEIVGRSADLWNDALGEKLLVISADGKLDINLIYDSRQETTVIQNDIGSTIESGKESFDRLKSSYDTLKSQYQTQKAKVESLIVAYQIHKEDYEEAVAYWNSQGGAPKKEFANLESQRQALNTEVREINDLNASLNQTVVNLNATADRLNIQGKSINENVSAYNRVGQANGPEFQEGEYISDKDGVRINIYQYKDYDKLYRVLAHEFGHALGLDHVSDPKAIMYTYNSGNNSELTSADLVELKRVCKL